MLAPDSTAHTANSPWTKPSSPLLSPLFSLSARPEASATTAIKSTGSGFLPSWLQENSSYFIHEKRGLWRSQQKNRKQIFLGDSWSQAGKCPGHQGGGAGVQGGRIKAAFPAAFLPGWEGGSQRANCTQNVCVLTQRGTQKHCCPAVGILQGATASEGQSKMCSQHTCTTGWDPLKV